MDSLHDEVAARWPDKPWMVDGKHDQDTYVTYYHQVREEFTTKGCTAMTSFDAECNPETTADPRIGAMYDLLGDDLDGAAALLEDAGLL